MSSFHFHRDVPARIAPVSAVPITVLGILTLALVLSFLGSANSDSAGLRWPPILIAGAALLYWMATPAKELAPPVSRSMAALAQLMAGLLALQIVPLPLFLIHHVSDARSRFFKPMVELMPAGCCAPLSLAPSFSLQQIARLVAWAFVFLLVRELVWTLKSHRWLTIAPILVLGVLDYMPAIKDVPGFPEMCLPFAILYTWEIVHRNYVRGERFLAVATLQLCGMLAFTGVIVVAILRSFSPTGALSILFSMLAMVVLAARRRWPRYSLPKIFLSLAAVGATSVFLLVFQPFSAAVPVWRDTLRMVADYPISGVGFGAFASAFPFYQQVTPNLAVGNAHNDYLQLLAEIGIPGLLVMLAVIVLVLLETLRAASPREGGDRAGGRLALACTAALTALLVHSLGTSTLYVPANAMAFAWIAGVAWGIDPRLPFSRPRGGRFRIFSAGRRDQRPAGATTVYPPTFV